MITLATLGVAAALATEPAAPVEPVAPPPADASFQLAVIPGVGWNASPSLSVNGASLGVLAAAATDVDGVGLGSIAHRANGLVSGAQGAGVYTFAAAVDGVQGSGVVAVAGQVEGVQGAGAVAVAGRVDGAQLSGGVSVADEVKGLQSGVVNIAGSVHGVQIGLVNVADEVDGVSLGLLNFVGNGYNRLVVSTGTNGVANLAVKFGTPALYTTLGLGWIEANDVWWTAGGGLGSHLPLGRAVFVDVDATVWMVADGGYVARGAHGQLRGAMGLNLGPRVAPFVALTGNVWGGRGVSPHFVDFPVEVQDTGSGPVLWPGVEVGLQL